MTTRRGVEGVRVLAALLVIGLGLLLGGGGSSSHAAPVSGAARLVPDSTLVFVRVSLDEDRAPVRRAADTAQDFPSYTRLRDTIVKQLRAPGCDVGATALSTADDAALALFDTGGASANSLVLIDTGQQHAETQERACGALRAAYVGRFLAIGQAASLKTARELQAGRGTSLAAGRLTGPALATLPADRVVDGWVSAAGVRRLLAPQGGMLGLAGTLVDQPALRGAAFALAPSKPGAELTVHSLLDPKVQKRVGASAKPLTPTLAREVPAETMAYLGIADLQPALQRLGAAAGSGGLGGLLSDLPKDVLALFHGESAVTLTPATPAPVMTILSRTDDEAASRAKLAKLPARVKKVFSSAVFDGKVALSTSPDGLKALRSAGPRLADTAQWRTAIGNRGDGGTSVVFLDFSRLLRLGEQTGLDTSRAYRQVADDLARIGAIGARSSGNDSESTAEISLLIS